MPAWQVRAIMYNQAQHLESTWSTRGSASRAFGSRFRGSLRCRMKGGLRCRFRGGLKLPPAAGICAHEEETLPEAKREDSKPDGATQAEAASTAASTAGEVDDAADNASMVEATEQTTKNYARQNTYTTKQHTQSRDNNTRYKNHQTTMQQHK